ncbi:hypothetical protein BH11MYX1_BH11MYX1_23010 [soil metagenome]
MSRAGVIILASAAARASAPVTPVPPRAPVPPLVGATEVQTLTAPSGYIGDAIAYDATRLAYVVSDGQAKSELHLVTPGAPEAVVDLAALTLHPLSIELLGSKAFVVGLEAHNEQVGALIDLAPAAKKPILFRVGPSTNITVIKRDGVRRIAQHRLEGSRHEIELDAIESGKRIALRGFELDPTNTNKALDFHVNHWSDGWTKAYGLEAGEWNPKENMRMPNVEATYDVVAGKISEKHPIADLFEQRKRYQVLADAGKTASVDFVRLAWDNSGLVAWRSGKATPIELDQPLGQYDAKSLQASVQADGSTWIALKVDPVNPDAVARQKADPEYFDLFKAGPDGRAVRKMRVLASGIRFRFGVMRDQIWLLARSNGFDRGGTTLRIYTIN